MACLACIGNLVVLISRNMMKEKNKAHSFYIKNLSVSDFLMGVYLFYIAAMDLHLRGEYILHQNSWRRSWQCDLCGKLLIKSFGLLWQLTYTLKKCLLI